MVVPPFGLSPTEEPPATHYCPVYGVVESARNPRPYFAFAASQVAWLNGATGRSTGRRVSTWASRNATFPLPENRNWAQVTAELVIALFGSNGEPKYPPNG